MTKGKRSKTSKKGDLHGATGISSKILVPLPPRFSFLVKTLSNRNLIETQPAFLSFLLATSVGTVILYICMILFGAPITSHFPHTILCAVHMALLVPFPLIYVNGVDGQKWRDIVSVSMHMNEAFGGALGALLGAWLGAVPIPLG